jgi:hypothetical protein
VREKRSSAATAASMQIGCDRSIPDASARLGMTSSHSGGIADGCHGEAAGFRSAERSHTFVLSVSLLHVAAQSANAMIRSRFKAPIRYAVRGDEIER